MGVSVLSKSLCDDLVNCSNIKISTIQGLSLKRSISLIVSSRRTLTPIATAFFNMCKDMYDFKCVEK